MYFPKIVAIWENALFTPVARLPIPVTAPKATTAMISTYSANPWPDSSICSLLRVVRVFFILFFAKVQILPGLCARGANR